MEVSSFVKNTWKLLSMKMRRAPHSLRVRSAVLSAEIIRVLGDDHAEADKNLLK